MSVPGKVTAWENAERQCFDWLRQLLSGTVDVDAFCGELPDTFRLNEQNGTWLFTIGGEAGDAPLDYDWNMDTPGGGGSETVWKMPALLYGIYLTRPKAIYVAGLLRASLPLSSGTLQSIYRFRPSREPSVRRGTHELAPDQEQGGKIRVWVLEYPMEVWFTEAADAQP